MTFLQMKCFLSLTQTRKMSVTATAMGLSLSTLSKYIDKMEDELSVKLFVKSPQRLQLTREGDLILPSIEYIVKHFDEQHEEMDKYTSALQTTSNVVLAYHQTKMLHKLLMFMQAEPTIKLKITEDPANDICASLDSGKADIGFVYEELLSKKYPVTVAIRRDSLYAAVSKDHHLADRDSISVSELRDDIFCLFKSDDLMYRYQVRACISAGFVPRLEHNRFRMSTILKNVALGRYVSFSVKDTADTLGVSGVSLLRLEEDPVLTMCAVSASIYPSALLSKLLLFLQNE